MASMPAESCEDLKMIEFIENAIELNRMSFKTRKSRPELDFNTTSPGLKLSLFFCAFLV